MTINYLATILSLTIFVAPQTAAQPSTARYSSRQMKVSYSTQALHSQGHDADLLATTDQKRPSSTNDLVQTLNNLPGIIATQSGGPGQQSSLSMRGAGGRSTLILIDDIPFNDAASPAGTSDPMAVDIYHDQSMAIYRGASSSAFGSGAQGGAINLLSATPTKLGNSRFARFEMGSHQTHAEEISASALFGDSRYTLGAKTFSTEGISAANDKVGNTERDAHSRQGFSASGAKQINSQFTIASTARYSQSQTELDKFGGPNGDDPNYRTRNQASLVRIKPGLRLFHDQWRQYLHLAQTNHQRQLTDKSDNHYTAQESSSRYNGQTQFVFWRHEFLPWGEDLAFSVSTGMDYQNEMATIEQDGMTFLPRRRRETNSVYLSPQIEITPEILIAATARKYSSVNNHNPEVVSIDVFFDQTAIASQLSLHGGTGFRQPSIFDLYAPTYGNPNREPERSRSVEIRWQTDFLDSRGQLTAAAHQSNYSQRITFDPANLRSTNQGGGTVRGIEFSCKQSVSTNVNWESSYERLKTWDHQTQKAFLREPSYRARFSLSANIIQSMTSTFQMTRTGPRRDQKYTEDSIIEQTELPAYNLARSTLVYMLTNQVTLTGRIENLFNSEYEDAAGFGTLPRSYYCGLEAAF